MTNVLYTKNSKSLLAKMMAEEDITIQHKNIDTAYFDIKNRILAVPIWKDMSDDLYDLFMGHEVGHALYTPSDTDILQEACSRSSKDFINVVEDARIERDVKNKFPGLRGPFFRAYQELMNKNFFGIQGKELSGLAFIDRINVFFKSSMTDFEMKKIRHCSKKVINGSRHFDVTQENIDKMMNFDLFEFEKYCQMCTEKLSRRGSKIEAVMMDKILDRMTTS